MPAVTRVLGVEGVIGSDLIVEIWLVPADAAPAVAFLVGGVIGSDLIVEI